MSHKRRRLAVQQQALPGRLPAAPVADAEDRAAPVAVVVAPAVEEEAAAEAVVLRPGQSLKRRMGSRI
jgi:hypothetical protein